MLCGLNVVIESSICGRIIIPYRNAALPLENGLSGVTKLDRIRNERIRGTTKVGEISKKVQESRLKWYGHVLRRRIRRQESDGDGGAGEKKRRRPKQRWLDSIRNDLSERGLSEEDAQDRPR